MDILKRNLAPITEDAWEQIEETASTVLKTCLTARHIVDFEGPKGWALSAVPLGTLEQRSQEDGVDFVVRAFQPLVEVRAGFTLGIWNLDDASRGNDAIDLAPLEEAVPYGWRSEEW
jgi:uncharacterized linocin/CFP29 family protein